MRTATLYMRLFALIVYCALSSSIVGCGEDLDPVYFRPADESGAGEPSSSENAPTGECTLSYSSRLCVVIKGDEVEAGTNADDPLCAEVDPFPIHISGSEVTIKGSEFPDVLVEGHGLPAPITINARGTSDGSGNTATGTIDAAGNMTVENFSFFIVALGMVGEIPGLTLTTGETDELPHLSAISGSPPDASGAMTIVTGTTLPHLFDAADKILMGASLQATFSGSITPTLSECSGSSGPRSIQITKLIIDSSGAQTDENIPDDSILEISNGTFIASTSADVGPRYESSEKFRVKNIGSRSIDIAIPSRTGAFTITSSDALTQELAPQRSLIITVSFHPTVTDTQPGEVNEQLVIGTDMFTLHAVARTASGSTSFDVVSETGETSYPNVAQVSMGQSAVPVNARREYFQCTSVDCSGTPQWTNCGTCGDPGTGKCALLALSTDMKPLSEVDASCNPVRPDATPLLTIDLKSGSDVQVAAKTQVVAIRNQGVSDLTITDIRLDYTAGSRSTGEFSLSRSAIFVGDSFSDVEANVKLALEGKSTQGTALPITLKPYQKGYREQSAYVVITYQPKDLVGSDGTSAGIGSAVTDDVVLTVVTADGTMTTEVSGSTTIREVPPLELYFKTPTGLRKIEEGRAFSFRQISADTVDSASPMFLKLADSATEPMRVTQISLTSGDTGFFEWLDTSDKINSKNPPTGKGMRCSIPIVDESTGQMTSELFDLSPVNVGSGFDLMPGAYSTETMPLFGCLNYHRDETALSDDDKKKRLFEATLTVTAQKLDAMGVPVRNPDGSFQESKLSIRVLAAINPRTGKVVFRITQTMSLILNPQFPGSAAIASREEMSSQLASGKMEPYDLQVFLGAFILDPFDEEIITDSTGKIVDSTAGDGITAVCRSIDSHVVETAYDDPYLYDYTSLLYDANLPSGERGVFEDFPGVPENTRSNPWRIFTSLLSYPGPLAPINDRPDTPSSCITVNPCDPEGLKKFTDAGVSPGEPGACAFFYASGGLFDSPAFHSASEMSGGEFENMCNKVGQKQNLIDFKKGYFSLDGSLTYEDVGLRFFGPTFFHNPGGPLGPVPPMDVVFHTAFTTDTLLPKANSDDRNVIPNERIDIQHQEYKVNLDDPTQINPGICAKGVANRLYNGRTLSSWTYLAPLLSKDEAGTIPAGCPESGINDFTGGSAFLHGRKLNHETGKLTLVAATKFGSSNDLTFAFKDVMMFIVLNGWVCDPLGNEEMFEGSRCYDVEFNDRDAESQISMTE